MTAVALPNKKNDSSVVLVLRGDDSLLCVTNRRYGGMSMPGGKADDGETALQAAVRELKEETDLTVGAEDLLPLFIAPGNMEPDRAVHVFLAKKVEGTARSIEAGTGVAWLRWPEFLAKSPSFGPFYKNHFPNGVSHLRPTLMAPEACCKNCRETLDDAENGFCSNDDLCWRQWCERVATKTEGPASCRCRMVGPDSKLLAGGGMWTGDCPFHGSRHIRQLPNSERTFVKINEEIEAITVRVIDADGEMLGVMSKTDAIQVARGRSMDLVQVNPKAEPPVCKVLNHRQGAHR